MARVSSRRARRMPEPETSRTAARWKSASTPVALLLATALAVQVALLATLDWSWPFVVSALAATAAIFLHARRGWHGHAVDAALVACCLGGLGMLAGTLVDQALGGGHALSGGHAPGLEHAEHAGHSVEHGHGTADPASAHRHAETGWASGVAHLASWSTLGMLALCVPSCLLLCPGPAQARCHLAGTVGMLAGMAAAGILWAPALAAALDSTILGHHVAMLVGMSLGTALGFAGARRVGGRRAPMTALS